MDPNEVLRLYRERVTRGRELADGEAVFACEEFLAAADLMDDLIGWLARSGFEPEWERFVV